MTCIKLKYLVRLRRSVSISTGNKVEYYEINNLFNLNLMRLVWAQFIKRKMNHEDTKFGFILILLACITLDGYIKNNNFYLGN